MTAHAERHCCHALEHFRCACGPLERQAPQEGDLGLAGVRRDRVRRSATPSASRSRPTRTTTSGSPARPSRLFDNHFPKQDDEQVLVQAPKGGKATDPAVRKAVDDAIAAVSRKPGVTEVQVALRRRATRARSPRTAARCSSSSSSSGDDDQTEQARRPDRSPRSARSRPTTRRCSSGQFGGASAEQGARQVVRRRLHEGRVALAADHADHPRARLRRARRGGRPAAARPDRGDRRRSAWSPIPASSSRWTTPSARSCCSSAWPWASTTRSSTCVASARSRRAGREQDGGRPDRGRHAPAAPCSSPGFTVMVAMAGMFFAGVRTFTALGVGAIMVVAVAMIGSVTVRAGRARVAGRSRREGPRARSCTGCAATDGESRAWGWILGKVLKRPAVFGRRRQPACSSCWRCRPSACTPCSRGTDDLPRKLEVMKVYDRMQAAFPGGQIPAVVAIEAKDVTTPQIAGGDQGDGRQAPSPRGKMNGPLTVDVSPDKHVASIVDPDAGRRHRHGVHQRAGRAARRHRRRHGRLGAGRRARLRDRHRRGHEGLQRPHEGQRADRVRLRAVAGLPAAAGDLPLDRHPHQGDRAEPAVGRRGLRDPDLDLPGRPLREAARLQVQRRHRAAGCRCSCS